MYCSAVSGEFSLQNGEEHSWFQGVRSLSFKCEVERTLCVRRSWSGLEREDQIRVFPIKLGPGTHFDSHIALS